MRFLISKQKGDTIENTLLLVRSTVGHSALHTRVEAAGIKGKDEIVVQEFNSSGDVRQDRSPCSGLSMPPFLGTAKEIYVPTNRPHPS